MKTTGVAKMWRKWSHNRGMASKLIFNGTKNWGSCGTIPKLYDKGKVQTHSVKEIPL